MKNDEMKNEVARFVQYDAMPATSDKSEIKINTIIMGIMFIASSISAISIFIMPEAMWFLISTIILSVLYFFSTKDLREVEQSKQPKQLEDISNEVIELVDNMFPPVPGYKWEVKYHNNNLYYKDSLMIVSLLEEKNPDRFILSYSMNSRINVLHSISVDRGYPKNTPYKNLKFNSTEEMMKYVSDVVHAFLTETHYLTHLPQKTPMLRNGDRFDFIMESNGSNFIIQKNRFFLIPDSYDEDDKKVFFFYCSWLTWMSMHMATHEQLLREKAAERKKQEQEQKNAVMEQSKKTLDSLILKTPVDEMERFDEEMKRIEDQE